MAPSSRLRDWRRKIKMALSSEGAFKAVTGQESLEDVKWAYESLDPKHKEYCIWLAGKMKLDRFKGPYLVAHFYVQGQARKDLGGQYKKQIAKTTKMMVKKFKLDKEEK